MIWHLCRCSVGSFSEGGYQENQVQTFCLGWVLAVPRLCHVRTHILTPLLGVAVDDLTSAAAGKQPEEAQPQPGGIGRKHNKGKTESNKMSL